MHLDTYLQHVFRYIGEVAAFSSLASWVYLTFFRGYFWRVRESPPASSLPLRIAPTIAVLIPARDEAASIGAAVTSLLTQKYSGPIRICVIDDNSSDGTAEVAMNAAESLGQNEGLQIVRATAPPTGWTGKLWALSEGLRQLPDPNPDYFLFTDADIVHSPENVSELIARAESEKFDLVSLMVKLRCESAAERAFIPAFLFFFFMLYPPSWIPQQSRRTAAAAGGCILIRPQALAAIGGIAAIRGELIDDCALARRVKENGGRTYLGTTAHTRSLRAYPRLCDVERMISRTAFTQLRHSTVLLTGTLLAMTIIFVAPPLLLFAGPRRWPAALAWLLISMCFYPSVRLYALSPLRALTLPVLAVFYMAATLRSALLYWRGRGGMWKGRVQDSVSV